MQAYQISDEFKKRLASKENLPTAETETKAPARLVDFVPGLQTSRTLLAKNFERSEPLIDGLLKERETVLFVGKPKLGKSRLIYQMAFSLTSGRPFLGHRVPAPRSVYYVGLEDGSETTQHRVRSIGGSLSETDLFSLYAPDTIEENRADLSRGGAKFINESLGTIKPDVLIIDPLRIFCGAKFDERKSEDVVKFYIWLAGLKKFFPKLTTIIVHHTRKGDFKNSPSLKSDPNNWVQGTSGSYALVAHAETVWGFDREAQPDGSEMIVFNGVARNWRVPLMLLDDCQDLSYRRLVGEDLAYMLMSDQEKQAWESAKALGTFNFKRLESSLTLRPRVLHSMLKKAEGAGVIDYCDGNYFTRNIETQGNIYD